ncbi:CHAT domain-containing protein [Tabrizicola sp. WMC-M-20]|nr:CHAT domain-containing protein [Tabrizicola sp. WMC-M-20]
MPTARVEFEVTRLPGPAGDLITHFRIRQEGANLPEHPNAPLDLDSIAPFVAGFDNPGPAGEPVAEAGSQLWTSLQAHENAAAAFAAVLAPGPANRALRVTFSQHALAAKKLPWEALLSPQGFLCDARVPIIREVQVTTRTSSLLLVQGEALRVLAVIAPVGNDGLGEWEALKQAALRPRAALAVRLLVMTSKPAIRDDIAAMANPLVTAMSISESNETFLGAIGDFRPQVAHFFGHGFAGAGASFLEIENSAAENGAEGRHHLNHSDMEQALSGSAWIVVLNACSLAGGGGAGTGSLAEATVARGVPVVIGMRDLVMPEVAHAFARTLHRSALDAIAALSQSGSGSLDIGLCFADACRAIPLMRNGQPHPDANRSQRDWALPSLHLRSGPLDFDVIVPAIDPDPVHNAGVRTLWRESGPPGDAGADPSERRAEVSGEIEMLRSLLTDAEANLSAPAKAAVSARILGLEADLSTLVLTQARFVPDAAFGELPTDEADLNRLLEAMTADGSRPEALFGEVPPDEADLKRLLDKMMRKASTPEVEGESDVGEDAERKETPVRQRFITDEGQM